MLMGLFPPWVIIAGGHGGLERERYLGHGWFLHPPRTVALIYVTRLLLQWAMVVGVVGGLVMVFQDRDSQKAEKNEQKDGRT